MRVLQYVEPLVAVELQDESPRNNEQADGAIQLDLGGG